MVGLARKWMVGAITPKDNLYFLGISGKELKELCDASKSPSKSDWQPPSNASSVKPTSVSPTTSPHNPDKCQNIYKYFLFTNG